MKGHVRRFNDRLVGIVAARHTSRLGRRSLAITALCVSILGGGGAQAAPIQWAVASGGNGHYYRAVLVPDGISWPNAAAAAQAAGGYLATINSAEENAFVFNLIDNSIYWKTVGDDTRGPWLGGFQPVGSAEPDGGWSWITGEPFAYTNWAPGEPNNFFAEDNLHFLAKGMDNVASTWNDLAADTGGLNPVGYIVESVPEPSGLILSLIAGFGVRCMRLRAQFRGSTA
jgi:hypothetical protein